MSRAAVLLVICVALTQGSRVGRSAARPLGRLRGGADREQSVEDALRFTRGCLVGVESEKSLATMLLPPFRLLMKFFGHSWVDEPEPDQLRAQLLTNLPLLRGGGSKLLAKYATNTSEIPKLSADDSVDGAEGDDEGNVAAKPKTTKSATAKPATAKPATAKPAAAKPAAPAKGTPPPGGKVIALTSAAHLAELLAAAAPDQLVVLDFTATWCGPCQQIAPVFARLASQLPHVLCIKVDADTHGAVLKAYGVKAFPTFVLLRRKSEISRMQGADAGALEASIRANAGKPNPWSTASKATGRTLR